MTVRRLGAGLPSAVIVPSRSEFGDDCAQATRGIARRPPRRLRRLPGRSTPRTAWAPSWPRQLPGPFPNPTTRPCHRGASMAQRRVRMMAHRVVAAGRDSQGRPGDGCQGSALPVVAAAGPGRWRGLPGRSALGFSPPRFHPGPMFGHPTYVQRPQRDAATTKTIAPAVGQQTAPLARGGSRHWIVLPAATVRIPTRGYEKGAPLSRSPFWFRCTREG